MSESMIELRPSHRREEDGSHTVSLDVTGIPDMETANKVSLWMRNMVRQHAGELGRIDPSSVQ